MGKESAPPPPDYSGIAAANEKAAELSYKTGQDQLAWAKEQYADIAPTTKAYLNSMINNSDQQTANAEADRKRYESIYQPVENKFVDTANGWNSADRSNQQAGAAMADVSNTFDQQRKGALSSLESYGIDPSQTRYGALDLGTRVQQAAATAAAACRPRRPGWRCRARLSTSARAIRRRWRRATPERPRPAARGSTPPTAPSAPPAA